MVFPELRWPAVGAAVLVLVAALLWRWTRRQRRRSAGDGATLMAGIDQLRRMPRFRRVMRLRLIGHAGMVGGVAIAVVCATLIASRPQTTEVERPEQRHRDIMLCLDASASMDDDNVAVVDEVQTIVGDLPGDRFGMTLWSQAAVTVLPLTDDSDHVAAQLEQARQAFEKSSGSFFGGVQLNGQAASLLSDGIVSCAQRFDLATEDRSRVIVVSSDNDPQGQAIYTLAEAAAYAVEHEVVVHGMGSSDLARRDRTAARTEFNDALATTGGVLGLVGVDGAPGEIVRRIDDLERQRVAQPPRRVIVDDSRLSARLAGATLGLLVTTWWGYLLLVGSRSPRRGRRPVGRS